MVSKYYDGKGKQVMTDMIARYGEEKGKRVFYATAKKKGKLPKKARRQHNQMEHNLTKMLSSGVLKSKGY